MEKKVVLNFNEFINEKLNNIAMDETIQGYIQQIKDGLSNDAMKYLDESGELYLISDGELAKLFRSDFKKKYD